MGVGVGQRTGLSRSRRQRMPPRRILQLAVPIKGGELEGMVSGRHGRDRDEGKTDSPRRTKMKGRKTRFNSTPRVKERRGERKGWRNGRATRGCLYSRARGVSGMGVCHGDR